MPVTSKQNDAAAILTVLIADSATIQTLQNVERIKIEQKLLTLPKRKIALAIKILAKEKSRKEAQAANEKKELVMLDRILKMQGELSLMTRELDRILREDSEAQEKKQSDVSNECLLNQLEGL